MKTLGRWVVGSLGRWVIGSLGLLYSVILVSSPLSSANAAIENQKSKIENSNDPTPQHPNAFAPAALDWLNRAFAAYSHVEQLEQRTEFLSTLIPLDKPKSGEAIKPNEKQLDRRLNIIVARPNKLRMETTEPDELGKFQTTQAVSDGKMFWTYQPSKNWYTKDKAPRSIADFAKLPNFSSGSLEMLMIMGINPFADLKNTATAVRDEGDDSVRDVPVHWVAIEMEDPLETTRLRIAIGKADGLIWRVVHERIPTQTAENAARVDDGLEALRNARRVTLPDESPTAPDDAPPPRIMTRLTYDNFPNTAPQLNFTTFQFTIPQGAFLYSLPNANTSKPKSRDLIKTLRERAAALRKLNQKQ